MKDTKNTDNAQKTNAASPLAKIQPRRVKAGEELVNGNSEEESKDSTSLVLSKTSIQKCIVALDSSVNYIANRHYVADDDVLSSTRSPIVFGTWLFIFVFVFILGWSLIAPLHSAAIASGKVVLDQNKKIVQHLEGGIISDFYVRDGDEIEAGSPLIRLSDVNARARLEIFSSQLSVAYATEARLIAERDESDSLIFHRNLLENIDNIEVAKIIDAQERLFTSRRSSFKGQVSVLEQRIAQLKNEIKGLGAQEESSNKQLDLIEDEVSDVKKLVDKGLSPKTRLLALKRKSAELEGNRGEFQARIARAQQSIAENDLQIINLRNESLSEILTQLRETQTQIADLDERIRAAKDVMERIIITAPQSGVVNNLRFHTVGGVIGPREMIMEIVPLDDQLIIEAQLSPQDIDIVYAGLDAQVQLSAYKMRQVPMLDGKVVYVSSDSLANKQTGEAYYLARIEVDQEALDDLDDVELMPGMPASVFILTGSKTPFGYMMDPILNSLNYAFREE